MSSVTSRSTGGPPGYANVTLSKCTSIGPRGSVCPSGPGSTRSAGVSRIPITRRHPAMAFCASVRIWVPICTGPTNSDTRNANASTLPAVISPAKPSQMPTTSTPAFARPAETPAQRERERGEALRAGAGRLVPRDRLVDPALGARLDRVRPDDGGPHDRLGDRRQQQADLAPYGAVGVGQLALEVPQRQEQRREADPDDDRELPAVDRHDHGGDEHLPDADHEEKPAEHQELADLVHVAGHPGDQRAPALGVLRQQRQVVHVPEGLDPQRGEARARRS